MHKEPSEALVVYFDLKVVYRLSKISIYPDNFDDKRCVSYHVETSTNNDLFDVAVLDQDCQFTQWLENNVNVLARYVKFVLCPCTNSRMCGTNLSSCSTGIGGNVFCFVFVLVVLLISKIL